MNVYSLMDDSLVSTALEFRAALVYFYAHSLCRRVTAIWWTVTQ